MLKFRNHLVVVMALRIPAPHVDHAPRNVYLYSKGKYDQFNLAASQIKWYDLLCDKIVDQQWMTFKELYEKFVEKYIPVNFVKQGQRSDPSHLGKDINLGLKLRKIKGRPSLRLEKQGYIAIRHYRSSKVN